MQALKAASSGAGAETSDPTVELRESVKDSFLASHLATSDGTHLRLPMTSDSDPNMNRRTSSFSADAREASKLPPRHATWRRIAFLLIADIVGVGILELGFHLATLGWVLGLSFMVIFFAVNLYTGILLSRLRDSYPNAVTLGDLAGYVMGSRRWAMAMWIVVYVNLSLNCGSYLLVITKTLQSIFWVQSPGWCDPWTALGSCCLLLIPNQVRTMNGMSYLAIVSFATIVLSVLMTLGHLLGHETRPGTATEAFAGSSNFWVFFNSLSGFAFAYAGQSIYLEMMAEMKRPTLFSKALLIGAPSILLLYSITAIAQYALTGQYARPFLIDSVPDGPLKVVVSISLLIHMLISYNITNQVVTRALHLRFFPRTVNGSSMASRMHWFLLSGCLLVSSWIIANAVPFFDNLTGIIGALLLAPISFIIPCLFYLKADRNGALVAADGMKSYTIGGTERAACYAIIAIGACVTLLGTISNIKEAAEKSSSIAAPFSCNVFNAQ